MSEKTTGIIQLVFVIIFLVGAFAISKMLSAQKQIPQTQEGKERIASVNVIEVFPGKHRITFETSGVVRARSQVDLIPEVSGRLVEISDNVFQGGAFKSGERLFQVNPKDFTLEIQRLEAEIARAKTTLKLQQAEAQAAVIEWGEINPGQDVPPLVAREPQMAEAEASLKAAQAQLGLAKLDLERAKFSFPFAGRVVESALELGQFVNAGQSYGQVFDIAALEVEAALEDQQLEWLLASGEDVQTHIQTRYLGQDYRVEGVLKRSAANLDSDTRFGTVSFGFKEPQDVLIPGVFVQVMVVGAEEDNVSVLPLSALQEKNVLWVVSADNMLKRIVPEILYISESEVTLRGLERGMRVVNGRINGASNGARVEIRNIESVPYPKPGSSKTDPKGIVIPDLGQQREEP